MIVVDIECTGLDWDKHSMVSIGAVDFDDSKRQFYRECKIWEGAELSPRAMEVNGFTEDQVRDSNKPTPGEVLEEFIAWAKKGNDLILAGQNLANYDVQFLIATAKRYDITYPFDHHTVDAHAVCFADMLKKGLTPPVQRKMSKVQLNYIAEYVGMPPEPDPHNALNGAKFAAEALSRLMLGKNLLDEFKIHPIPTNDD